MKLSGILNISAFPRIIPTQDSEHISLIILEFLTHGPMAQLSKNPGPYSHIRFISFSHILVFSSPDHKVLMVSFCDRPMSGVRRPSCVVHNFFKHLLLLKHRANLDETWQGCSVGEALPKLFKRLNSNHNSGCHGNQYEKNSKIFENLLL